MTKLPSHFQRDTHCFIHGATRRGKRAVLEQLRRDPDQRSLSDECSGLTEAARTSAREMLPAALREKKP